MHKQIFLWNRKSIKNHAFSSPHLFVKLSILKIQVTAFRQLHQPTISCTKLLHNHYALGNLTCSFHKIFILTPFYLCASYTGMVRGYVYAMPQFSNIIFKHFTAIWATAYLKLYAISFGISSMVRNTIAALCCIIDAVVLLHKQTHNHTSRCAGTLQLS